MPNRIIIISAFGLLTLFSSLAVYAGGSAIAAVQQVAIDKRLWLSQEWINLLHYYPERFPSRGLRSHVDDSRFFNAGDGDVNPRAEMLATLAAFYRTDIGGDEHPICRFPARLAWLETQIGFERSTLPEVVCTDYTEWRRTVRAQQVTLIFPTYHLNSPSSMFGHTLLRLDRAAGDQDSKWLSFAVNFGADVQAGENSLLYAIKGLSGGYPGIFIVTPYYNKIREYNRIEKRDIWEYRLNLTPQEVERMIVHLWELKEINFDYYFFDENCSFRLLELLEVARPGLELTDMFEVTAIPIDTVKAIEEKGLIEETIFRPSQMTELQVLLAELSHEEQNYFEQLATDVDTASTPGFTALNNDRQQKIIDAAYRYQRYQQLTKPRDEKLAGQSHALLSLLNGYPTDDSPLPVVIPVQPEKGHHSRRISLGAGERDDQYYQELSFRMAFHSLEDNEYGFLRGAHINMANLQLHANNETDKVKLQRLDLIDIFSLTPRSRFFDPLSWRVYTGLERQMTDGVDRLTTHVSGGGGVAYSLLGDGLFYALATGRLEFNRGFSDKRLKPAAGAASGILWHFGSMSSRVELAGERFSNGKYRSRLLLRHTIPVARNHALHFSINGENHTSDRFVDASFSYRYHF